MKEPTGGPLYKIVEGPPPDADVVPWADVDRADGFVHLSAAHQVRETATKHFAGRGPLALLEIDPDRLGVDTLRWEPSRGGADFPHVHGDVPASAVTGVDVLPTHAVFPVHVPTALPPDAEPGARALRLESAEASTLLSLARGATRAAQGEPAWAVRGVGVAVRFSATSPINAVKGWGLDVPVSAELLDEAEALLPPGFAVEVASHADPAALPLLAERGYRAVGTENVLVRELAVTGAGGDAVTLVRVSLDDADAYSELLAEGFGVDHSVTKDDARSFVAAGQCRAYFIEAEGRRVGVCSMRLDHELALLTGSCVLPAFRGRGYHSAAIRARLRSALRGACRYAKQDVQPGSTSHRNAHRAGFVLSHTRTSFIR